MDCLGIHENLIRGLLWYSQVRSIMKWPSNVNVAKHDYNRTKDSRFCVSLNEALIQDSSIIVHFEFR